MRLVCLLACLLVLAPGVAEARFGKANSTGGSTHRAEPVRSRSSSSSSSSSGGSFGGSNSGVPPPSGGGFLGGRPARSYFWNQAYRTPWWLVPAPIAPAPVVVGDPEPVVLPRVTVNADFMAIVVAPELGYTLGLNGGLEGDYFGLQFSGQQISVQALDSSGGMDHLQQFQARLSYAFLQGELGRIRGEAGADLIFAPDMIFFGATVGFSGVLNIGGPFALEASMLATFFPFWQLDARAGVLLVTGPLALRLGWRSQLLDDRGTVDGVVHRDVFHGPTAGVGLAF